MWMLMWMWSVVSWAIGYRPAQFLTKVAYNEKDASIILSILLTIAVISLVGVFFLFGTLFTLWIVIPLYIGLMALWFIIL